MRFLLFLAVLNFVIISGFSQGRSARTINSLWKFHKGDLKDAEKATFNSKGWSFVNLPHTWNDKDVLADGERGYYRGIAWYRKHLPVSKKANKKYFLHFEGANQEIQVFVNEKSVGKHAGGYTAFTFDITDFLNDTGNNLIALKVDNSHNPNIAPLSADFTFFGGVYRDVFLVETNAIHFDMLNYGSSGIFISTPQVSADNATVIVKGTVMNEGKETRSVEVRTTLSYNDDVAGVFRTKLKLKPGKTFFELSGNVEAPKLWSPANPNLYTAKVELVDKNVISDLLTQSIGFRYFTFDANDGLILNGKPVKLIGANRHQDYLELGNALPDEQHRKDLELLKEMGGNFIRLAHYPQDPAVLEAADKLGLIVWEEIPLVNEVTLVNNHDEQAEQMLREMIRQHYNHPSVFIWGYMNEIYWAHRFIDSSKVEAHTKHTLQLAKKLETIARSEDPSRYTAMAMHNYPLYEESGIDTIAMIAGVNFYHGWYYDKFEGFGKHMDRLHAKYKDRPHIISEYGAGADLRTMTDSSEKFDFSIDYQQKYHESYYKQIMERPYIAGAAIWNLIDFSSERRIDPTPHVNNKGLMTADRQPKDTYYFYQAALLDTPFIKIAETNWTDRTVASPHDGLVNEKIKVYTNVNGAELFVNGKSYGRRSTVNQAIEWSVQLLEGKNKLHVKSTDAGDEMTEDHLTIHAHVIAHDLSKNQNVDLAVNSGSKAYFIDPYHQFTWFPDKPYSEGSWGYVGGKPLYIAKKVGTKEDILTADRDDPLYQMMRVGMSAYKFDVPKGNYEVELLFVEPFPKSRRFVDGVESPEHEGGVRVFSVLINEKIVLNNLDLLKDYGYNYPLREKFIVTTTEDDGITISFEPKKGEPIVSGIKVRRIN